MAMRTIQPTTRTVLLLVCESALILVAIFVAAWIRLRSDAIALLLNERGILRALLITGSCQLCL